MTRRTTASFGFLNGSMAAPRCESAVTSAKKGRRVEKPFYWRRPNSNGGIAPPDVQRKFPHFLARRSDREYCGSRPAKNDNNPGNEQPPPTAAKGTRLVLARDATRPASGLRRAVRRKRSAAASWGRTSEGV